MFARPARILVPLFVLVAGSASAQPGPAAVAASAPAEEVRVDMVTEKGRIVLALDRAHAPITTANFLRYVDQKRFDGIAFYRAMRFAWDDQPSGLIQAGTQNDPARVLKPIAHEPTSQTGILHKAGTLSMARYAPGTATGDFTIMLSDIPSLDADPTSTDADRQAGFAAFGHVVEGMDVVRAIFDAPVSPTKGVGVMKGQMLEPQVRIVTVRRLGP